MPEKRRQDNFILDVDGPGEEEFGIANMIPYSFYHGLSFPNKRKFYTRYIALDDVPPNVVRKWKRTYLYYLRKLTLDSGGKQLVLKNPPNTARVKLLLELFPNAKFINICRNPYNVFPSTVKMYNNLIPPFFLQKPDTEKPDDVIFDIYEDMHRKYFEEKHLIPEENLVEPVKPVAFAAA